MSSLSLQLRLVVEKVELSFKCNERSKEMIKRIFLNIILSAFAIFVFLNSSSAQENNSELWEKANA